MSSRHHPRLSKERLQRYLHRSDEEMREDLVAAFDEISSLKLKVWVLIPVVMAEAAMIGWLASALLTCINELHRPLQAALRLVQ